MKIHRFFIEEGLKAASTHRICDTKILHQMRDVFRLSTGDKVILFDGNSKDILCKIDYLTKKEAVFIEQEQIDNIIPEKNVMLFMSLIKKDNFELVLEKGTELGVKVFVPVITERVQKKNIDMVRAGKIVKEASEQCGRGDLPTILEPEDLENVLEKYPDLIAFDISGGDLNDYKLLTNGLSDEESYHKLLIGPEGGWSEKELQMFKEKKIRLYKLGNTTLRAETAAIVASANVLLG